LVMVVPPGEQKGEALGGPARSKERRRVKPPWGR